MDGPEKDKDVVGTGHIAGDGAMSRAELDKITADAGATDMRFGCPDCGTFRMFVTYELEGGMLSIVCSTGRCGKGRARLAVAGHSSENPNLVVRTEGK